ncbi:MAG: dipeptidase, partial [Alphaproteobacteria bacterium]
MAQATISERAAALYADALVWDDHSGFEPRVDADLTQLQRWARSGVTYLSVDVGYDVMDWQETVKVLAAFRAWILARPHDYVLAESVDDILRAEREDKLAVTFDIEGMNAIDGDVNMIALYYALGVRQMLFAYNRNNLVGGGCHDEDVGLTPLGRRAVEEMNRVGMLIDCSHTSHRATMEAMELSTAPVIFSHSNPRALRDHGRNITDEQIKACAATGGVVGINGIGIFLGENDTRTETFVHHIDYVAQLVGAKHVGLGLDYAFEEEGLGDLLRKNPEIWPADQGYDTPDVAFVEPERLPAITAALLDKGYAE